MESVRDGVIRATCKNTNVSISRDKNGSFPARPLYLKISRKSFTVTPSQVARAAIQIWMRMYVELSGDAQDSKDSTLPGSKFQSREKPPEGVAFT